MPENQVFDYLPPVVLLDARAQPHSQNQKLDEIGTGMNWRTIPSRAELGTYSHEKKRFFWKKMQRNSFEASLVIHVIAGGYSFFRLWCFFTRQKD